MLGGGWDGAFRGADHGSRSDLFGLHMGCVGGPDAEGKAPFVPITDAASMQAGARETELGAAFGVVSAA